MLKEINDFLKERNILRKKLAILPTPLEKAENLSSFLGGPEIFFKRDDLTGLCCGGNKVRKLEFLMADAIEKVADIIVTGGGTQSNHAAQTASACARLGLKARLVLKKPLKVTCNGNLLLEKLMGTEVRFVSVEKVEDLNRAIMEECNLLKSEGYRPYFIPLGGSNLYGVTAYAMALLELHLQAHRAGIKINRVFTACGTGGTLAGLIAGNEVFNCNFHITGISVGAVTEGLREEVISLVKECSEFLGKDFTPGEIDLSKDYIGAGYGTITPEAKEAIEIVASKEGIFLDPVYTGKAMAGLIDFVRRGPVGKNETVVFFHTGGLAGLFADGEQIY